MTIPAPAPLGEGISDEELEWIFDGAALLVARAYLTLLSARQGEDGWQPIETAPKDGTEIIGCYFNDWGDGTRSVYGPWTVAFHGKEWRSSWDGNEVIEYMSDFGIDYRSPELQPSHWQPLPPPPSPSGEAEIDED